VDERKATVARGYDGIAQSYATWQPGQDDARSRHLARLRAHLPIGASVLDLGCGTGAHATAALAEDYAVVGVDLSERSLRIAQATLHGVSLVLGDIGEVAFAPESFDAVIALYSLIHVPRDEHAEVLDRVASWLRPGGRLVITMGAGVGEDGTGDFLGAEMYWSSWDGDTNVELVRNSGLDLLEARDETVNENGRPITHRWIAAARPGYHPAP
jgi:SAM-dependent methyltransferase